MTSETLLCVENIFQSVNVLVHFIWPLAYALLQRGVLPHLDNLIIIHFP